MEYQARFDPAASGEAAGGSQYASRLLDRCTWAACSYMANNDGLERRIGRS